MNSNMILFILGSFATFRLAELLCCEDGPYDVIKRFRDSFSRHSQTYEMLTCFYCTSVWAAAFCASLALIAGVVTWLSFPLWVFGFSGGAVAILRSVRPKK